MSEPSNNLTSNSAPAAKPPRKPRTPGVRKPRAPRVFATVSARIPGEQKRILDDLSLTTGVSVDDLVRFAVVKMLMDGAQAIIAAKGAKMGAESVVAMLGSLPESDEINGADSDGDSDGDNNHAA